MNTLTFLSIALHRHIVITMAGSVCHPEQRIIESFVSYTPGSRRAMFNRLLSCVFYESFTYMYFKASLGL